MKAVTRAIATILLGLWFVAPAALARNETPTDAAQAEIAVATLPAEARETISLIRKGGPFPFPRDGVVFGNFEERLPARARGYYREYTVRTPGAKDRGARRIVAGRGGELYYTDDHYNSFRRIREDP
ncbi:MAG TPA: ribonuclease domain-containing protein [Candidatus Acidoferrales bacterium]|nr:ribonuclease domain-containing protein [Candidatus Acidoferrales bacterium]